MGIAGGQQEPSDTLGPPDTLAQEEITNNEEAAEKSQAEDEVAVGLAAPGNPWPVASAAPAPVIKLSLLLFSSGWRTLVNIL